jgi:hypothetical protein
VSTEPTTIHEANIALRAAQSAKALALTAGDRPAAKAAELRIRRALSALDRLRRAAGR